MFYVLCLFAASGVKRKCSITVCYPGGWNATGPVGGGRDAAAAWLGARFPLACRLPILRPILGPRPSCRTRLLAHRVAARCPLL